MAVIGTLVGLLAGLVITLIGAAMPWKSNEVITRDNAIYSISNQSGIEGSFVLGTGTIKEEMYYYYFIEEEYGKKLEKIKVSDCYLQDTDGAPTLIHYSREYTNPVIRFLFGEYSISGGRTIIYVPPDTVKEVYNIDISK